MIWTRNLFCLPHCKNCLKLLAPFCRLKNGENRCDAQQKLGRRSLIGAKEANVCRMLGGVNQSNKKTNLIRRKISWGRAERAKPCYKMLRLKFSRSIALNGRTKVTFPFTDRPSFPRKARSKVRTRTKWRV